MEIDANSFMWGMVIGLIIGGAYFVANDCKWRKICNQILVEYYKVKKENEDRSSSEKIS